MRHVLNALGVAFLLALAEPAHAQDVAASCHPVSPTRRVVVELTDGSSIRGTLLCLTQEDAILARDAATVAMPLASVRRIRTPADPIWDGFVKGASIPLVLGLLCECRREALKAALAYGTIGATWDLLVQDAETIYLGRGRRSLSWRIRF